jgi:hypothetical protein
VKAASQNPAGQVIAFWAMTDEMQPMTDQHIEREISLRKADAPANARIVPITWLAF